MKLELNCMCIGKRGSDQLYKSVAVNGFRNTKIIDHSPRIQTQKLAKRKASPDKLHNYVDIRVHKKRDSGMLDDIMLQ